MDHGGVFSIIYLLNLSRSANTDRHLTVIAGTIFLVVMDRYSKACTKTERVGGGEKKREQE